jgi:hypothetical protein
MKKKLAVCLLLLPFLLASQIKKEKLISAEELYPVENDTIVIPLEEVFVYKKRKFASQKEKNYYYWYYKKVHKAYPYAVLAAKKITEINADLDKIPSKRKKKKHIREMQKYMEGEFTDELKHLTRTEGRILIKLIHRQTGTPFYELIKDYKSDLTAFFYNTTAKFYKLNLKSEYHPESVALDFVVEDILVRSFANGTLVKHQAKLPINYFELSKKWESLNMHNEINAYIEKYK